MTPSSTPTAAPTNGTPTGADRSAITDVLLGEPLTQGYRSQVPYWTLESDWMPQMFLLRDVEVMLTHPIVTNVLRQYESGISYAEFWGGPDPSGNPQGKPISDNQEVSQFVQDQCNRFWDRGIPLIQKGGYPYGWSGSENMYEEDAGKLAWSHLLAFSPRDTFLLTVDRAPAGIRVKNVLQTKAHPEVAGQVDLFMATRDVPAKGLWYAHQPRFNAYYGTSQLLGAWRPWRRLAWKDSAEQVIDTGIYRFAFCGPVVRYPEEDSQPAGPGIPGTTLDSQGKPRRFARDFARQLAEWVKAGAGIGLPSTKYPAEMGGGDKWGIEWPSHVLNAEPIIAYIKYLQDQIAYGIGVPPELLASGETGSGYSGRAIPLEAFLTTQQRIADAFLHMFVTQVLRPLVRWNWGPNVRFNVSVKPLIMSKQAQRNPQGQQAAPGMQAGSKEQSNPGWPRSGEQGTWMPFQNEQTGQSGWRSQGGQVRYQPAQPGQNLNAGLSLLTTDNHRRIANRILGMSQAA